MINLTQKFSILSPKILLHRIELCQDRYLSMRAACAQADIMIAKSPWDTS